MVLCLIVGCGVKSGRDKGVYLARVPQVLKNQGSEAQQLSELRRNLWISAISRDDLTESVLRDGRVCNKHFASGRAAKSWDRYNPDWVPSLNLGHNKISGEELEATLQTAAERDERARTLDLKRAEFKRLKEEIKAKRIKIDEPGVEIQEIEFPAVEEETGVASQTEEFEYLFVSEPEEPFNENWFKGNDKKVNFYTALPAFDVLQSTFKHVAPHVRRKSMTLSKFQEFVMTIIKLKLNMPMQDLAYRFGVSLSSVSRIFQAWMEVMDVRLTPLIIWPEREELIRTMPQCFQFAFGNKVTVVIDCFEVFIDRLSNVMARAQTYSSYKSHNTVKVLIGITPQGTVSFVSQTWGGVTF